MLSSLNKIPREQLSVGTNGTKIESIQKDKVLKVLCEKSNCYFDVFEKSLNQIWFVSITELSQPISLENDFLIGLEKQPEKNENFGDSMAEL